MKAKEQVLSAIERMLNGLPSEDRGAIERFTAEIVRMDGVFAHVLVPEFVGAMLERFRDHDDSIVSSSESLEQKLWKAAITVSGRVRTQLTPERVAFVLDAVAEWRRDLIDGTYELNMQGTDSLALPKCTWIRVNPRWDVTVPLEAGNSVMPVALLNICR